MSYFTGNGYGVSQYTDVSGAPLLTWSDPATGKTITLFDRVAVSVDPTLKQPVSLDRIYNARMDSQTSAALKTAIGGTAAEELDHKIPLELGGSNQLANLGLDTNNPGARNNQTDTFENELSAAVQSGSLSLVDAWRSMAASKGFVLAEDLQVRTNNGWAQAADSVLGAVKGLFRSSTFGQFDKNLKAQIDQDGELLSKTPNDIRLRTKLFTEQINLTAQQLNLSKEDAASYMKVYTARYAQGKNQSPTEIMGAFTANEQQLLGVAGKTPNLLGVDNVVWTNVAAALTVGQGVVAGLGVVAFVIALFVSAPADAVVAAGASGVAGILASFGISGTALSVAAGTFLIYEALGQIASRIPMITKQALDSEYIVPSLIASALNDDVKNLKQGGSTKSTSSSRASSGAASSGSYNAPGIKVFTGVISSGNLGNGIAFTPRPDDLITSIDDLNQAAKNNLAPFMAAIGAKITYEIKIVSSVTGSDGLTHRSTTQRIVTGHNKNGTAKYKTVTNKFAELVIYALTSSNSKAKLATIVLGPTDAMAFSPTPEQLSSVQTSIQSTLFTSNIGDIKSVSAQSSIPAQPVYGNSTLSPNLIGTNPTTAQTYPAAVVSTQPTQASSAPALQKYIGTTTDGRTYEGVGSTIETFISDKEAQGQAFNIELIQLQAGRQGRSVSGMITSVVPKVATKQALPAAALSATTLSEYYSAIGQSLPSVSVRSDLYHSLGLGQIAYYTGTAEQNTKLLQALKS